MSEAASLQSASGDSPGARRATQADAAALTQMLGRAFHDDPMMCHLLPDVAARPEKMPRVFALLFKMALPFGACDVTSGYEAAAIWRPPGHAHIPFWQYITNAVPLLGTFGAGVLKVMQSMDVVEKVHPKEPHWYLQAVGTDPDKQGKGHGGRVIRHQLAKVDEAGLPAYLESSKDTNIPIYQRLGFEVTGEIQVPDGPILYPMWRKARR